MLVARREGLIATPTRTEHARAVDAERLRVRRRVNACVILGDDERASLVPFALLSLLYERLDRLPLRSGEVEGQHRTRVDVYGGNSDVHG